MKTIKLTLLFFSFLSIFILSTSCKKETVQSIQSAKEPTAYDFKIHRIIETFKSKLNTQLKESELMSIDSVVWYIEASLNETYARADNSKEQIWIDSAFMDIPLTDNKMVLQSDVTVAYNTLIGELTEHYYEVTGEKGLILVDISLLSTFDDKITIRMKDYIAYKPIPPVPNNWTFGPTDYWYWGNGMGKCTEPGFQGLDATTQITSYANHSLPFNGNTQFFTNLCNSGDIFPNNVIALSPNPFGFFSYMLYENGSPDFPEINDCLTPAAMNYYLNNLKQIALLPQYLPAGKSVANYCCTCDIVVPNIGWLHLHRAIITYGIPTVALEPPQEL